MKAIVYRIEPRFGKIPGAERGLRISSLVQGKHLPDILILDNEIFGSATRSDIETMIVTRVASQATNQLEEVVLPS